MKAIGLYKYLPISNEEALLDIELEKPVPQDRDVLVAVKAVSVNPVDTKVRSPKDTIETEPKVLGWDAAGEVIAIGKQVEHYQIGDPVYYAGDITRPGSNAEYQLVDERIVGKKPSSLDFTAAAALPLTTITAWEALFDRLNISKAGDDADKSILIVGGAGGVGSIAIQLAKKIAKLHVIATASRPETIAWVQRYGADQVINHHKPLHEELKSIGIESVDYILCLNNTDQHWLSMADAIAPQGMICTIVETSALLDVNLLKSKSAGLVWEFMYTRSMYQTPDMIEQQHLLNEVADLIDAGKLQGTLNETITPINATNLRKVHAAIEAGSAIGKTVLTGWK